MSWIDIVLIVLVGGFILTGLWAGFVQTLGNLIGAILGIIIAGHYVDNVMVLIHSTNGITRVVVYLILYALVSSIFGALFWIVCKLFSFIKIIPLVPTINHLLGAVLGLVEGLIAVGAAIFIALQFLPASTVTSALSHSVVAAGLLAIMQLFKFLLPQAFQILS